MDIDAGNGNPATFMLTDTVNGAVTAYERPWSMRRSIGLFAMSDSS